MNAVMPQHAELAAGMDNVDPAPVVAMVYKRDVAVSERDTYVRITKEDYVILSTLLEQHVRNYKEVLASPIARAALGRKKTELHEEALALTEGTRDRVRAAKDFLFKGADAANLPKTDEVPA